MNASCFYWASKGIITSVLILPIAQEGSAEDAWPVWPASSAWRHQSNMMNEWRAALGELLSSSINLCIGAFQALNSGLSLTVLCRSCQVIPTVQTWSLALVYNIIPLSVYRLASHTLYIQLFAQTAGLIQRRCKAKWLWSNDNWHLWGMSSIVHSLISDCNQDASMGLLMPIPWSTRKHQTFTSCSF